MKRLIISGFVLGIFASAAPLASAADDPYVTARILSARAANSVALAAMEDCAKRGFQVSVAVVDRFGNELAFLRHSLAGSHTITVAKYKAFTAATFQGATIDLSERLAFLKGTPKLSLVGGGVPIRVGGFMYGAVGVSGAPREKVPGDVDDACARSGIAAIQADLEFAN